MTQGDQYRDGDTQRRGADRDGTTAADRHASDPDVGAKASADRTGGVRRQDGPEPFDEARRPSGGDNPVDASPGVPEQSGYEENGPGRGDYPGRARGGSTQPQRAEDRELDARSRWRDADRDEGSERWRDDPEGEEKASP